MQSIKEHNLKANHNLSVCVPLNLESVCNLSKNTIWKQITTVVFGCFFLRFLYAIYQRTQFESKSQLTRCRVHEHYSVCNLSKNTIWKQITTIAAWKQNSVCLYAIYQRTQFESKSQRCWTCPPLLSSVCNLSKNTIWKQITTIGIKTKQRPNLYAIYQRTQFESKSQLCNWRFCWWRVCMQSIKEHNLKANHNMENIVVLMENSVCNLSKNTIWKQITTR